MLRLGRDAWEADVLAQFANETLAVGVQIAFKFFHLAGQQSRGSHTGTQVGSEFEAWSLVFGLWSLLLRVSEFPLPGREGKVRIPESDGGGRSGQSNSTSFSRNLEMFERPASYFC